MGFQEKDEVKQDQISLSTFKILLKAGLNGILIIIHRLHDKQ